MEEKEPGLPRWPLRLTLSLVFLVEVFFTVMLSAEGFVENAGMIANSVGLLAFCVLIWLAVPWSRWAFNVFLLWRVAGILVALSSHFGDHRTAGSLVLVGFYVVAGVLVASPLGRVSPGSTT